MILDVDHVHDLVLERHLAAAVAGALANVRSVEELLEQLDQLGARLSVPKLKFDQRGLRGFRYLQFRSARSARRSVPKILRLEIPKDPAQSRSPAIMRLAVCSRQLQV